MKKKKKSISEVERIRLERAKHKKEFLKKMEFYVDYWGGKGTFATIPRNNIDSLYDIRFYSLKLEPKEVGLMSIAALKRTKTFFHEVMKSTMFSLSPDKNDLSLEDFMTIVLTLNFFLKWCKTEGDKNNWSLTIYERLSAYIDEKALENGLLQLRITLNNLSLYLTDLNQQIVALYYTFEKAPTPLKGFNNSIKIHPKKPDIKHFTINKETRPAFRVTWTDLEKGFLYAQITSSLIGVTKSENDAPIDVYIQSHALNRLSERIDCLNRTSIQGNLYESITINPIIVSSEKNKVLVEYRILTQKLGYLACEYIDGALLIRTFLFITNNGTPEGKKLYELTGLGKLDKKYLALDKLSSYINSDINTNETLKTLFTNAGCESLLNIDSAIEKAASKKSNEAFAKHIAQYLDKDRDSLDLFEEEED